MAVIEQAGERRLVRLESVRALCALGVLVGHVAEDTSWHDRAIGPWLDGLSSGVYVFFVLSGFLIYRPFARRDFGGGGPVRLGAYYRNRALRVLPLYWFVVVVLLLVQEGGGSGAQWLHFLTFTQNYFDSTFATVDIPMWTIVAEVQFYVALPLLAWLVARVAGGSIARGAGLLLLIAAVSAAVPFDARDNLRHPLILNGFLFIAGMLLAVAETRAPRVERLPAPLRQVPLWLAAAVVLWAISVQRAAQVGITMAVAGTLVGACVLPLDRRRWLRWLDWRALALVGVVSYGVYLWHQPVIDRLEDEWSPSLALVPVVAVTAVAIAAATYALVERPCLRLRRRWF